MGAHYSFIQFQLLDQEMMKGFLCDLTGWGHCFGFPSVLCHWLLCGKYGLSPIDSFLETYEGWVPRIIWLNEVLTESGHEISVHILVYES